MPDWTDPNQHDPGVTLLELLAWVACALAIALGIHAYRRRRAAAGRDDP